MKRYKGLGNRQLFFLSWISRHGFWDLYDESAGPMMVVCGTQITATANLMESLRVRGFVVVTRGAQYGRDRRYEITDLGQQIVRNGRDWAECVYPSLASRGIPA